MRKNPFSGRRTTILAILITLAVLTAGAGIASAAVSGSFSSSYDGWNDGSNSDTRGHEIQVTGTIEVTGDSAVNPRIVIRGADNSVLDQSSVQVFVEGDRSINFDRSTRESAVVYRADEIPAGTTLRVEYGTYYIGGADSGDVTVGEVNFNYETPGGSSQQESFSTQNALENRPENVIDNLEQQTDRGETLSTAQEILSYVGILAVIFVILKIGLSIVRNGDDDDIDI
jgi:urease beta subunit